VLLLAATTGYQVRAFGEAADRLGVELVYATDRCNVLEDPWEDGAVPVRFFDTAESTAAVMDVARDRPIDGVLAVGDRTTALAAHVNAALGLRGHSVDAAYVSRSKQSTRERLRDRGLPVPWFVAVAASIDARTLSSRVSFPCVVKPMALSGSRGVIRVDDERALAQALERLRAILRSPDVRSERNPLHDMVLVEGFIPGREFAVEGVMNDGALHVLAIFDKPDPLDGPFFEETIYVTPSSASAKVQQAIADHISRAVEALGLTHGPVHAECRVNEEGVYVLEVAARPIGGLCARALRFIRGQTPTSTSGSDPADADTSISLEEVLLRHAVGESTGRWVREAAASGVMMVPIPRRGVLRGVTGIDRARSVPHVVDVRMTAKIDQVLVPLPEGRSYLGFIFGRADRSPEVERALRDAHRCLEFAIDTEVPVLQSPNG
jgi:hypothetical protein